MAILTILTHDDIAGIIPNFPALPRGQFSAVGIPHGSVNTFYRLIFAGGSRFFLRIDEVADKKRLENELAVLEHLRRNRRSLSAPPPFPLASVTGRPYVPFRGKFALVFPEVPGRSLSVRSLAQAHLKTVGARLAEWHLLPVPRGINPHRFDPEGQARVFRELAPRLRREKPALYRFIAAKLEELRAQTPRRDRPVLIHADLFTDNLLWTGKRLNGMLDLDSAGRGPALFDLAVCLHALCHDERRFFPSRAFAIFRGYESVRPIPGADKKRFSYYLESSAMRFLLTRLRDFALAPAAKRLGFYKDYRVYERRFGEVGGWKFASFSPRRPP